jgi:hypothetical protein
MQCASCTTTGLLPGWACISLCRWGGDAAHPWQLLPELAGDGPPAQPLTGVAYDPPAQPLTGVAYDPPAQPLTGVAYDPRQQQG